MRAIETNTAEATATQLSFFDLNPPPHSAPHHDGEDDPDSELSLESSMESVTLLGQETAIKDSLSAQV